RRRAQGDVRPRAGVSRGDEEQQHRMAVAAYVDGYGPRRKRHRYPLYVQVPAGLVGIPVATDPALVEGRLAFQDVLVRVAWLPDPALEGTGVRLDARPDAESLERFLGEHRAEALLEVARDI